MPDFDFLGGETVHYPLSNGVDKVSEQFFFAKTGFNLVWRVSREKEKEEIVRLKLKSLPWLASVWQKARQ